MQHSIRAVSRRTGLTAHVIRIWEKRYAAVQPQRTATQRRLYSEADVERLNLLSQLTRAGQSISQVAKLPTEALQTLLQQSQPAPATLHDKPAPASDDPNRWIAGCLQAVRQLDAAACEAVLERATLALGIQGLIQQVLAPLTQSIGCQWREGLLTAAHEHFATATLRTFLSRAVRPFALPENSPTLLVTTPAGQLHELGAVMVSALATNLGWRVLFLGASLPAREIAGAALRNHVRAVALSIVYPEDDPHLAGELESLRHLMPANIPIIVGGRAAGAYVDTLTRIGAHRTLVLSELNEILDRLRRLPS